MNPISPFDNSIQLLGKVMDLRATKAQTISSNIANAETPGYSPVRYDFEQELAAAIGETNELQLTAPNKKHIPLVAHDFNDIEGKVRIVKDTNPIGDENGVSVNEEMLALSENELLYESSAQLLKKKLSIYKYVVADGS